MTRRAISAEGATAIGPYSHAVESGGFVFCSGQTPIDPVSGKLVSGTIIDQTSQCLKNLFAVLQSAGLGPQDVVNVQVYLTNMLDFTEMNQVYAEQFTAPYPARTTIGVASLPLGADVEIGLVAKTRQ